MTPVQGIDMIWRYLQSPGKKKGASVDSIFESMRRAIFLDRLNWVSDISRANACALCNYQ